MKPINQEQVVQTSQVVLAVLSDEDSSTPNKYLEGVVSGKSLLRGIISGQLVVCQAEEKPEPKAPAEKAKAKPKGKAAAPADIE
jgi:hypothetical protein